MPGYHKNETVERGIVFPEKVEIALLDAGATAKEGLLALAVGVGFQILQAMMEEEVNRIAGPKGKHQPEREVVRHLPTACRQAGGVGTAARRRVT